jgi:hypothetical protein
MPSVSRSQTPEWSDFTDSSLSKSGNPPSWSNFTDSDQVVKSNVILAQSPADQSIQIRSRGSCSPCPVWSSDWSSCPTWSSFTNSSNDPQEKEEAASFRSSSSSESSMICDQNYIPDSTFGQHIPASKPQSESNTSDHVTPTIGMSK